jgi:hypothetical protein
VATQYPAFSKWSSAQQFVKNLPGWVPPDHQLRIAAYQVYREIYWSHIASDYKVMNRGLDAEDMPLYVPSSRVVVDTLNRYVGPKLTFQTESSTGNENTQLEAKKAFTDLFTRERFNSRYAAAKRDGIIEGDWGWHITADATKPAGQRLSLVPFKAQSYFPVYEDETVEGGDPDKLVMVVLAELVVVGEDQRVRTQRYIRQENGQIQSVVDLWEPDKWFLWRFDDDAAEPVANVVPASLLPPQITAFPVYHIPHRPETGEVFGTSPMRGLEVLQAGLNQGMTDEDLALALMGLGVYATDEAGSPRDAQGNLTTWAIYPGAVIENSKGLRKVEGLTGLQPYTEHLGRLEGYMADATGATDAARGRIEVTEAESGIALQLRLGPTLSLAEEQDQIILDVHAQMFYDLVQMWFPAFEGMNFTDVTVLPALGDKLPVNRKAEVDMVNSLVLTHILSAGSARQYLEKKGFTGVFDPREGDLVLAEITAEAAAAGGDTSLEDRAAQEQAGQNPDDGGLDAGPQE